MRDKARQVFGVGKRAVWGIFGGIFLLLGLIGIPLPLLPTTPFLLLAVFCFSRSSQRLHDWLVEHPRFGGPIRQWQDQRAISRKNKILAVASMAVVFSVSLLFPNIPSYALMAQAAILIMVALFLITRPEPTSRGIEDK